MARAPFSSEWTSNMNKKSFLTTERLPMDWVFALREVIASQRMVNLFEKLDKEAEYYPHAELVFKAFELCSPDKVRVVIVGQDPYHGPEQANGLAFSVSRGCPLPPPLENIYAEIERSTGQAMPEHGDLTGWARQGVLLLNRTLTVTPDQPGSHASLGWDHFTGKVIEHLSSDQAPKVFMLWGKAAQAAIPLINPHKHLVLTASHPSPLACYRGFVGCDHFTRANVFLRLAGKKEIIWNAL